MTLDAKKFLKIGSSVDGYKYLAWSMERSNRYYSENKILDVYNKCAEEFPNDAYSHFNRGVHFYKYYWEIKDFEGNPTHDVEYLKNAIGDFKKAISLNPKIYYSYELLIRAKSLTKRYEEQEILNDFRLWIEQFPNADDIFWPGQYIVHL